MHFKHTEYHLVARKRGTKDTFMTRNGEWTNSPFFAFRVCPTIAAEYATPNPPDQYFPVGTKNLSHVEMVYMTVWMEARVE